MFIYCICTQYLVGAPFALITALIRRGMEVTSLWHCWCGMEAQVALIAAFSSSALLGLVSLLFLLTIPHRFSMGFRSGEFAGQSSTVTPWSLNQLLVPLAVWAGTKSCWKWNQHLQQQMTWQPKSSLTVETSHWTSSSLDSVPLQSSSRPDSGTLISKWNAKFTFIWKEDFGPLSNSPVLFLHSPGKMLLTLSLVQKWLGSSFPEDFWAWWLLMHWLQLQSIPCEALPSVWISFAWQYSQACSHPCCLCTFSYPISSFQSTLHLICFDTALCKQPHLSVMTLCDLPSLWRASMFVFWIIAKSAVFPIIVVSKNKRYPEFILYGWSFIETQM